MSKNAHIWEEWGVGPKGHDACDAAMPAMLEAIRIAGPQLARVVFSEAMFQTAALPDRDRNFQKKHRWTQP